MAKKFILLPFDLEKAKAGEPVCTRDGRDARVICWDRVKEQPIIALVNENGEEMVYAYTLDGKFCNNAVDSKYDLMMKVEIKESSVFVNMLGDIIPLEEAKAKGLTDLSFLNYLIIKTYDGKYLKVWKHALSERSFGDAQEAAAEIGEGWRCPTRHECIDMCCAQVEGLNEALRKIGGGKLDESWTCESEPEGSGINAYYFNWIHGNLNESSKGFDIGVRPVCPIENPTRVSL